MDRKVAEVSSNTYGLTFLELYREYCFVRSLMTFSQDDFSAYRMAEIMTWYLDTEKVSSLIPPQATLRDVLDNPLAMAHIHIGGPLPQVLELAEKKLASRKSQGFSAGLMAYFCVGVDNEATEVSLNKAAHLTSKEALNAERSNGHRLKTGEKRILQNFREYRNVCHYLAADLVVQQKGIYELSKTLNRPATVEELLIWQIPQFLFWAEFYRTKLIRVVSLDAARWGMRPRLFPHCQQPFINMDQPNANFTKMLADYVNPNMGPY